MRHCYKLLLLTLVWHASSFSINRCLKRSPSFDALVAHIIATQHPPITPHEIPPTITTSMSYDALIKRLNKASLIYFVGRLLTYDIVRSTEMGKIIHGKENFVVRRFGITNTWLYKLVVVTVETLILKTIVKSALYTSHYDAVDGIMDTVKRLFKIILSI